MKKYTLLFLLICSSAFAEWYNPASWFKAPVPTRPYTLEEAESNPWSQKFALREGEMFFIDEGYVFRKDLSSKEVSFVSSSKNVKSILMYKNLLVAMQEDGDIYLLTEDEDGDTRWVDIGNSAVQVFATESDLVALVDSGELWVFKGEPGDVVITFMPMMIGCGNGCMTVLLIPLVNGHRIAFFDSGVKDVHKIYPQSNGDLKFMYKNGLTKNFKDLEISNPSPNED